MRIFVIIISIFLSINSRDFGSAKPQNSNFYYGQQFQQPYQQQYQPQYQQQYYQPQTSNPRVQQNQRQNYAQPQQTNYATTQRVSAQKCDEYSTMARESVHIGSLSLIPNINDFSADQCDVSQGLIIGGENAKPGEFPHMVAIGYIDINNQIIFRCGGSLISEQYVLTAAHCRKAERSKPSVVRVGDLNLAVKEKDLPEENIQIEAFIAHEQYDPSKSINDIAVVRLVRNIIISKYVRPACLVQPNTILHSNKAIATGWGATISFGGGSSDIMQKVELDLLHHNYCNKLYENYVGNTQLCAGIKQGGKDTCQGDSGGPLQIRSDKNKCIQVIIAITSYGFSVCGAEDSPAIYTKVSPYLDWIERQVWRS